MKIQNDSTSGKMSGFKALFIEPEVIKKFSKKNKIYKYALSDIQKKMKNTSHWDMALDESLNAIFINKENPNMTYSQCLLPPYVYSRNLLSGTIEKTDDKILKFLTPPDLIFNSDNTAKRFYKKFKNLVLRYSKVFMHDDLRTKLIELRLALTTAKALDTAREISDFSIRKTIVQK